MRRIQSSMDMPDEIDLHEKGWIAQRVGWAILLLILLAASLGLFGNGLLSKSQTGDTMTTISYEKFGRYESSMEIKINTSTQKNIELKIPQPYLRKMELEKVVPLPEKQRLEKDNMILTFLASDIAEITIYLVPQEAGKVSTSIEVNGKSHNISHFIYP